MTPVRCPHCDAALSLAGGPPFKGAVVCAQCATRLDVETFPALHRGLIGRRGVTATGEEATCFFHADKQAEETCDQCGRFMCGLCEIRVGQRVLCPACFEAEGRAKARPQFARFRLLYPHLALVVGLLSLSMGVFGAIAGPLVMGLAVFGFFKRNSVTGRRDVPVVLAGLLLGAAETAVLIAFGAGFLRELF